MYIHIKIDGSAVRRNHLPLRLKRRALFMTVIGFRLIVQIFNAPGLGSPCLGCTHIPKRRHSSRMLPKKHIQQEHYASLAHFSGYILLFVYSLIIHRQGTETACGPRHTLFYFYRFLSSHLRRHLKMAVCDFHVIHPLPLYRSALRSNRYFFFRTKTASASRVYEAASHSYGR